MKTLVQMVEAFRIHEHRFVIMSDHKGQVTSAFENGVLTCCEYEEG